MVCTKKSAKILLLLTVTLIGTQYLVNVLVVTRTRNGIFTLYKNISVVFLQRTAAGDVTPQHNNTTTPKLEECPVIPPDIHGHVTVNTQIPSWAYLEEENVKLEPGGRYHPPDCIARNRVAIIIPFRDREVHLKIFLQNIHPFLQHQQLDYGIYVVEIAADIAFNRALLMNIGFVEALKEHNYQCFIFHDVDLVPEDDRNLYTCPQTPRHMSVAIDRLHYKLPYTTIFGGVSAITKEHFEKVNGFSNVYFGWGGEDDDMYRRIRLSNLTVSRYSPKVARYKMLTHKKDSGNPHRFNLLKNMRRFRSEGLTSLNYTVIKKELKRLYTWVLIRVDKAEVMKSSKVHDKPQAVKQPIAKPPVQPGLAAVASIQQSQGSNNQPGRVRKGIAQVPLVAVGGVAQSQRKHQTVRRLPSVQMVEWMPPDFKGKLPDYLNRYDFIDPQLGVNKPLPKQQNIVVNKHPVVLHEDKITKGKLSQESIQQALAKPKIPRPPKVNEQGIVVPVFQNSNNNFRNNNTVINNSNNKAIIDNIRTSLHKALVIGEREAISNKNRVQYVIVDTLKQSIPKPP